MRAPLLPILPLCAALAFSANPARSQAVAAPPDSASQGAVMMHARGAFEVKVTPDPKAPGEDLASYTLAKTFTGDLTGTSTGQMLSAGDPKSGNAGYVALERIAGTLAARTGSFALMQSGTMTTGSAPQLTATIVPGSGTGDLSGIYGSMTIIITAGKHSYTLDYAIANH